jgi:L-fuculose-phosphate aldolase
VACTAAELPAVHYAMVELGGALRVAPYATYGSEELAVHVLAALEGRHAALLQNHGSVAIAETPAAAVERLVLTEWAAELYARCRGLGTPRILSEEELDTVAATVSATGYGTTRPV